MGAFRDESFAELVARELPRLLRFATMLTGDGELARDLVQDVLLNAERAWARVSAADRPDRYLTTMVVNAHLSWRRRWSVRHVFAVGDRLPDQPVLDHATAVVERDDVWNRLTRLPRQQRAVLVLRYYEQLSDAEIADVLGCAVGTVRGHASRALATLREQAAEELDPIRGD